MLDNLSPVAKSATAAATHSAWGFSVIASLLGNIQPIVAVFAGLAGGILACLQVYDWFKKRMK